MSAHTPGPWSVNREQMYNHGEPWIIWGPQGPGYGAVANVAPYCPPVVGKYRDEVIANARLIAAAPELLEALADLLAACPTSCEDKALIDAQRKAEAALAKAEGRTP